MRLDYTEQQAIINSEVILKGTLTIPRGVDEKLPAVLIVSGSGMGDRDGNVKKQKFITNIYKELAHFIAGLGFVVLRYDKRGVGESGGDHNLTGMRDLINDIIENVKFLQGLSYVDKEKIILMGHSEGCILSTIANTIYPVRGMVLLSGAGTSIRAPMEYQSRQLVEEVKNMKGVKGFLLKVLVSEKQVVRNQQKLFDLMQKTTKDVVSVKFQKLPAKWFCEHLKFSNEDVLKALAAAECPVLAITGDKDIQADYEDLKQIEKLGRENIDCRVIPNMDHLLKEYTGEKSVIHLKAQYRKGTSLPIHPMLKSELESWML